MNMLTQVAILEIIALAFVRVVAQVFTFLHCAHFYSSALPFTKWWCSAHDGVDSLIALTGSTDYPTSCLYLLHGAEQ